MQYSPDTPTKVISTDKEVLLADLLVLSLVLDPLDDVDHLVDLCDSTIRDIVDQPAPLRTKEMTRRRMLLFYNKNILAAETQKVLLASVDHDQFMCSL